MAGSHAQWIRSISFMYLYACLLLMLLLSLYSSCKHYKCLWSMVWSYLGMLGMDNFFMPSLASPSSFTSLSTLCFLLPSSLSCLLLMHSTSFVLRCSHEWKVEEYKRDNGSWITNSSFLLCRPENRNERTYNLGNMILRHVILRCSS